MISFQVDPVWPWSIPSVGLALLLGAFALLVVLTFLTYRGIVSSRRLALLLSLRLLTLIVSLLVVLRPSFAVMGEQSAAPSRLLICVDSSTSMNVTDEFNNLSRWDNVRRLLSAPAVKATIERLSQDHRIEFVYYQGAEGLRPLDLAGKAEGKRTDIGTWLHEIWANHSKDDKLRGLLLFTDGADNGTRFPALTEASQYRDKCPIIAFAAGQPTTTASSHDIAMTRIFIDPEPVPIKTKLTVKGLVDAPGFENAKVNVGLSIADARTGKVEPGVPIEQFVLPRSQANEVTITCDAPAAPGEYKVTMRVEPLPGEVTPLNNEITTYMTVTKEGLSVLWVDGRLRYETQAALQVLARDRRFQLQFQPRLRDGLPFKFDKQYDVLVIGDITAERFSGGDLKVFQELRERVTNQGMGLLMLGGFDTFANSDWPRIADITSLLPVTLDKPGQFEGPVKVSPTDAGAKYLLRLSEDPNTTKKLWESGLDPLDGMTFLGQKKETGTLLASRDGKEPVLVSGAVGRGRVLVFAGSTTHRDWRRSSEAIAAYQRFWQNLMLWLAHQENAENSAWIKLDRRRIAADSDDRLNFSVGLRGQSGSLAKEPHFQVKVVGPDKEERDVVVRAEGDEYRGFIEKLAPPGEYTVKLVATGKENDGRDIAPQAAESRFLAYAEDRESLRTAADHELLAKIAASGGGEMFPADETKLLAYLQRLLGDKESSAQGHTETYPDWRRSPSSASVADQFDALWNSAALPMLLLFVALLATEWILRRRWGLV